jgi:two-component system cell cycle sensor histidine kinase/response regulator CckA
MPSPGENAPLKRLRLILVEDCQPDAELLLYELQAGGYDVTLERVETAEALRAALDTKSWDLVLSDYSLPSFSAPEALAIVQETHAELPFIIVSGTIGEDTAVTALKAGAADFLVKGRLARLLPAIERELREAALRSTRVRERQALEDQLRQSQKLEGIGRLAGGIAHDFNNLLTAIMGYTEMILDQIGADKPISRDLEEIRAASERAVGLTRQLLAFSRKQTLHLAPIDLNEVVSGMRDMLQRLIGEAVTISLRLTPALAPILADRTQLEQILMNLVVNARDAMPEGGTIIVDTGWVDETEVTAVTHETAASGNYARLRVVDTGAGMDAATQSRIFEPFFTTKPVGQGTGLGLSTVYGVMQQLGGHLGVTSQVGRGTTFTLYFPEAARDGKMRPAATRKRPMALAEHREVVLVVEDQRGVRQLVFRILTRHGYTVLEAASAADALALFEQQGPRIDLLLTDVVMPGMSGAVLAEKLTALRPDLSVLFMSGFTGTDGSAQLPASATIVEKPFTASILLQVVRDVLDRPTPASPAPASASR